MPDLVPDLMLVSGGRDLVADPSPTPPPPPPPPPPCKKKKRNRLLQSEEVCY